MEKINKMKKKKASGGKRVNLDQGKYNEMINYLLGGDLPDFKGSKNAAVKKSHFKTLAERFRVNRTNTGGGDVEFPYCQTLMIRCEQRIGDPVFKLYVPEWHASKILNQFHPIETTAASKDIHQGINKTYNKIGMNHYGITEKMVANHLSGCKICEMHNSMHAPVADVIPIRSTDVNQRWVIDTTYMMDFKDDNEGYAYIGVIIDHFSKYAFAFPLRTRAAEEWAIHVVRILLENDAPEILHSDNGGEFVNLIVQAIVDKIGTRIAHGAPYNPREQGIVEKFNSTIKLNLAKLMNQRNTRNWVDLLPLITSAYNTTPQTTIRVAPFTLYHGRPPTRLTSSLAPTVTEIEEITEEIYAKHVELAILRNLALRDYARANINKSADSMEKRFFDDQKETFKVGDRVLINYKIFEPRALRCKSKKNLLQERWPVRGEISGITTTRRYNIKLDNGEELERISCRYLKMESSAPPEKGDIESTCELPPIQLPPLNNNNDKGSSDEESDSDSDMSEEDIDTYSSEEDIIHQQREAFATRRQRGTIVKPNGMSETRFFKILGQQTSK